MFSYFFYLQFFLLLYWLHCRILLFLLKLKRFYCTFYTLIKHVISSSYQASRPVPELVSKEELPPPVEYYYIFKLLLTGRTSIIVRVRLIKRSKFESGAHRIPRK